MFKKLNRMCLIATLVVAMMIAPVLSNEVKADPIVGVNTVGPELLPFAGALAFAGLIVYLNATQKDMTDGPFTGLFPVVDFSYPDSAHHNGA